MRIFTNRNFIQKLIIAIICVILISFCLAPRTYAEGESTWGGKIMSLMIDFTTGIADVAGSLAQMGLTGKWMSAVDDAGSGTYVAGSATEERRRRLLG